MKKCKIYNMISYGFNIILIGFILFSNKGIILGNNKIILKNLDENTQVGTLNKSIDELNISHTKYANYIQTSKDEIINAINMYTNSNATEKNSFEELSGMINNLTNIPENTYYYEKGTEGDSSTIKRYKKVNEEYYVCDANGMVIEGTSAIDVSEITLIPYNASIAENMSAGFAGFASGLLYLGDGSNNTDSYDEGLSTIKLNNINSYSSYDTSGILSHTFTEDGIYLISIGKSNLEYYMNWNVSPPITSEKCIAAKNTQVGWSSVFLAFYEFKAGDTISFDWTHLATSRMAVHMNVDKFN